MLRSLFRVTLLTAVLLTLAAASMAQTVRQVDPFDPQAVGINLIQPLACDANGVFNATVDLRGGRGFWVFTSKDNGIRQVDVTDNYSVGIDFPPARTGTQVTVTVVSGDTSYKVITGNYGGGFDDLQDDPYVPSATVGYAQDGAPLVFTATTNQATISIFSESDKIGSFNLSYIPDNCNDFVGLNLYSTAYCSPPEETSNFYGNTPGYWSYCDTGEVSTFSISQFQSNYDAGDQYASIYESLEGGKFVYKVYYINAAGEGVWVCNITKPDAAATEATVITQCGDNATLWSVPGGTNVQLNILYTPWSSTMETIQMEFEPTGKVKWYYVD